MRLFITGTDTDIGKTAVSAALAAAAKERGSVIGAKPVASGVAPGTRGEDAERLAAAAGHPPLCMARYEAPVSPHRAILDGDPPLSATELRAWIAGLRADTVIVEGVGGWRVPLQADPRIEIADLARWTGGPVVVVAGDRLGVINHTRLTVDAVRADGLEVLGVVLNRLRGGTAPTSNLADLQLLLDCPVVSLPTFDLTDPEALRQHGRHLWHGFGQNGADHVLSSAPEDSC